MNKVTITYYNVEQMVPNSSEGIGVWGWTCQTTHDKITDRAEAEAKMAEEMARFETYLAKEYERATSLACHSQEVQDHIANLQANAEFRIVEDVREFTHVSQYGYSDVHAYEITKVISDKTIEIRAMTAKHDISHLKQYVGGFSGHVENQRNQKVTYESDQSAPVVRIRKKKNNPESWTSNGQRFGLTEAPYAFYDYNF
tara:strand:- start:66 stop:662 length:597 start_codon:yes stop_codon:yes gene_type:complete